MLVVGKVIYLLAKAKDFLILKPENTAVALALKISFHNKLLKRKDAALVATMKRHLARDIPLANLTTIKAQDLFCQEFLS